LKKTLAIVLDSVLQRLDDLERKVNEKNNEELNTATMENTNSDNETKVDAHRE
jgi:hypothetical protein